MPTQNLQPTLRFAPSPTGELHIGHALSALINQRLARKLGGRLLLRIEDIDLGRRRQEFVDGIYRDLEWIGLEWDEPVLQQSERLELYHDYLDRLDEDGLLYPCFASRKEIVEAAREHGVGTDPEGAPIYPQLHKCLSASEVERRLAAGEPIARRIDMAKATWKARDAIGSEMLSYLSFDTSGLKEERHIDPLRWGDVVLGRKDNDTSYHIACTVDDALQGVTHVIRGKDLEASTDIHRLLQVLLDLPTPYYHHHDLILGEDGRKLSKSYGDTSLRQLRESGIDAEEISERVQYIMQQYDSFEHQMP